MKTNLEFLNCLKAGLIIEFPIASIQQFFEYLQTMQYDEILLVTVFSNCVQLRKKNI